MLAKHNSGGGNIEHITGLQCCTPIDDGKRNADPLLPLLS